MPRIQEDDFGYYFILNGCFHGHWRSKAEAIGGREVEMRRAKI